MKRWQDSKEWQATLQVTPAIHYTVQAGCVTQCRNSALTQDRNQHARSDSDEHTDIQHVLGLPLSLMTYSLHGVCARNTMTMLLLYNNLSSTIHKVASNRTATATHHRPKLHIFIDTLQAACTAAHRSN